MGTGSGSEAVGAVLGRRWRLLRLIGEGGLASVFEAEGLQGQGRRAIKVLQPQYTAQRSVVERFYAEARACHTLRHPNIASVEEYDYAEDGSPFMVMELLAGSSLDEYLRTHPPMPVEVAAPLVLEALSALSVAHASGVVHRDLKPPNLFLTPNGAGGSTMKVLDFGIAKVMDLAGGMGRKTRTGALLGTPGYMSPEQIRDAKSCDARSDLWSLAVVFYEMLTHRHPYGDDDLMARAVAILRDPPRPIAEVAPHLVAWQGFFQQALARDAAQRFRSADEMAHRIRELVTGSAHSSSAPRTAQNAGFSSGEASGAAALEQLDAANARPTSTMSSGVAPVLVPAAYGAAAASGNGDTRMSELASYGGGYAPQVDVVTAASLEPPSVVWWVALLLALGSFAAGIVLGYSLAS